MTLITFTNLGIALFFIAVSLSGFFPDVEARLFMVGIAAGAIGINCFVGLGRVIPPSLGWQKAELYSGTFATIVVIAAAANEIYWSETLANFFN